MIYIFEKNQKCKWLNYDFFVQNVMEKVWS